MPTLKLPALCAFAVMVAAGCDGPPSPEAAGLVVHGQLVASVGVRTAGATVEVRSYPGPCASADTTRRVGPDAYATTDTAGRYATEVEAGLSGPVEGRCLAVRAGQPSVAAGSGPRVGTALADAEAQGRYERPFDSLRVDVGAATWRARPSAWRAAGANPAPRPA